MSRVEVRSEYEPVDEGDEDLVRRELERGEDFSGEPRYAEARDCRSRWYIVVVTNRSDSERQTQLFSFNPIYFQKWLSPYASHPSNEPRRVTTSGRLFGIGNVNTPVANMIELTEEAKKYPWD